MPGKKSAEENRIAKGTVKKQATMGENINK